MSMAMGVGAFTSSFPNLKASNNLLARLSTLNIDKIAFLRHGNAPSFPDLLDFDRTLSSLGKRQCASSAAAFKSTLLEPIYSTIVCSPSPRTIETAKIFLINTDTDSAEGEVGKNGSSLNDQRTYTYYSIDGLYDATMQPSGNALFQKHGYNPLRAYLEDDNENDRYEARRVLGGYAQIFLDAMDGAIGVDMDLPSTSTCSMSDEGLSSYNDNDNVNDTQTLLFVGHAVYLPSAVLGLNSVLGGFSKDYLDLVLDTNTKEAEGYLVNLRKREIELLTVQVD